MLCGDRGLSLSRGNGTEGHKELVVHCTGVVQKAANNFLDSLFAWSIQEIRRVILRGELGLCPVGDGCASIWGQPAFRRLWVLELGKEVINVASHANATAFVDVVPLDVDSGKLIPCHVALYSVVLLEEIQQVVEMFNANVFDTKVVHKEAKLDRPTFVTPQSRNGGQLVVPLCFKTFLEEVICQDA